MRALPAPAQLRLRMALPAALAVALVASFGWRTIDALSRAGIDALGLAAGRAGAESLVRLGEASSEELGATLGSLARDPELTEAVAARDARRVLAAAGPLFHELRRHHGITHWSYWEPEGAATAVTGLRNLVRLGTPTLRGDVVERETLARAVREHALVYGIELGYTGIGLRVVAPVRRGAELVGYGELGRDVDVLLLELTGRTGDAYIAAVDKRCVERRRWAAARAAHGERDDWDDREDFVLVGNPTHARGVPSRTTFDEAAGGAPISLPAWVDGQHTYARGAFPLRDGAGRRLGVVFAFRDVTALAARSAELRRQAGVALVLVAALALAALGIAFELLVVRAGRILQAPRPRPGPLPGPPRT